MTYRQTDGLSYRDVRRYLVRLIYLLGTLFAQKMLISLVFDESVTNGPTDGRTDGRTDGPTDGRTDPLIEMRGRI